MQTLRQEITKGYFLLLIILPSDDPKRVHDGIDTIIKFVLGNDLHNTTGPAVIYLNKNKQTLMELYYENGKFLRSHSHAFLKHTEVVKVDDMCKVAINDKPINGYVTFNNIKSFQDFMKVNLNKVKEVFINADIGLNDSFMRYARTSNFWHIREFSCEGSIPNKKKVTDEWFNIRRNHVIKEWERRHEAMEIGR